MRLTMTRLAAATLLLAFYAAPGRTQVQARSLDSASVTTRADSAEAQRRGHNWFVSLLRKIARRSDDATSGSTSETAGSEVTATAAASSERSFKARKDRLAWESARTTAEKSEGYRVIVDLCGRQLRVIDGHDTLRTATVATAMNATLEYGGKIWRFTTPRGGRPGLRKDRDPV